MEGQPHLNTIKGTTSRSLRRGELNRMRFQCLSKIAQNRTTRTIYLTALNGVIQMALERLLSMSRRLHSVLVFCGDGSICKRERTNIITRYESHVIVS